MFTSVRKPNAQARILRFGKSVSTQQYSGELAATDGKLSIGDQPLTFGPMLTAGCVHLADSGYQVTLLCWTILQRIELPVASENEGHRVLESLGLIGSQRTMTFEVLAPLTRSKSKSFLLLLFIGALIAAAELGLGFLWRATGHEVPEWAFGLLMIPVVMAAGALLWNAQSMPVNLTEDELQFGSGAKKKAIRFLEIKELTLVKDGVALILITGEHFHLKTSAVPAAPDPIRDVLYYALSSARARYGSA